MSIHPEDAMAYAAQLHEDLAALTKAVETIAELLAQVIDGEPHAFHVRQKGAMIYREDRP